MRFQPVPLLIVAAVALLSSAGPGFAKAHKPGNSVESIEVSNAGFENGLQGWEMRQGPEKAYSVSKAGAFAGEGSAQIMLNESSTLALRQAAYFARTDFPTAPGYYRLQFAAKTGLQRGEFGLTLVALDSENIPLVALYPGQGGMPLVRGESNWQEYSVIYRLPENVKTLIMQLQVTNAEGVVALDEVSLSRLDDKTGKLLMNQQSPQAPTLQDAGARRLDAPCRVVNPRQGTLYRDPTTGRTQLALNSCTPGQGSALLIDYENGKSTVVPFPAGAGTGGWDLIQTAPDRMLFESLEPLYVIPVDLKNRTLASEGMKAVPGNDYAWSFASGSDGWIYMGSYPTAHLYRYHPQTYQIEDMGLMGPEGNLYNRHVGATSDGWVLSSVMLEKNGVVAFNPQSKEQFFVENATDEKGEGVTAPMVTVGGLVYANLRGALHQFDASQKKFTPAVLPPAPNKQIWTGILASSTPSRKVLRASDGIYYLAENGKELLPVWNLNLRGGSLVGVDEQNRVIGFRGQEYFVAEPMTKAIQPKRITEHPLPIAIHFLRADPQGGVTGGPNFGQTLFRFDPARKLLENTPQVVDGGGEVYDGRWIDGKFYFVAYSGGDLAVWDPEQPWDQWNAQNPKVLYAYNTQKDGSMIRPIGGLVVGPRGRLYSGWSGQYGEKTGALGEYDLTTNQARSWRNDIFEPEMSVGSIAADDRYVYGVTSNQFSGITLPTKPIVFWVFDPIAEKVVFKQALENARERPAVVRVPGTGYIWLAEPAGLHRFDPETLKFTQKLEWPREAGAPSTISASDARGDKAWFTAGSVVVRLDDGDKPEAHAAFGGMEGIGSLAAGEDGMLYFTQGVDVWSAPQAPQP